MNANSNRKIITTMAIVAFAGASWVAAPAHADTVLRDGGTSPSTMQIDDVVAMRKVQTARDYVVSAAARDAYAAAEDAYVAHLVYWARQVDSQRSCSPAR